MNGEYEHYFDGISSEKQAHFDSLTLEELEAERKRFEKMEEW